MITVRQNKFFALLLIKRLYLYFFILKYLRAIPIITTSPSYIDTGMVRGNQKIATFTLTNVGEEVLRNARIEGPSTSWMTLTINKALGDIQPGVSKTIGIMFNPPSTLSQGVYDDRVVIYSDNHIPYTYHIQVTVTSNAVGNVMFDVLNEFMEDVPGATITLQHQLLTELIYTLRTGTDGTVMQYDIPEGRYTYNVSPPPGHMPYSGTFVISPGMTTTVPIALEVTMVTVSWSVTPTVIQDKYEIVITQTFETNVPAPVLITEPPSITLPDMQPGQVFNGEFSVTNYGLIAVDNVNLNFPLSILDYDIEVLTSAIPKRINAMQKITVPYRITRRMQTAYFDLLNLKDAYALLLEEVKGYGGSSCLTSFNVTTCGEYVICPNTAQQRKGTRCTSYTVGVPTGCPSYYSSGGGGYVPPPSGGTYYAGGGGTQGGGGALPPPAPTSLQTNCVEVNREELPGISSSGPYSTFDAGYVWICTHLTVESSLDCICTYAENKRTGGLYRRYISFKVTYRCDCGLVTKIETERISDEVRYTYVPTGKVENILGASCGAFDPNCCSCGSIGDMR